MYTEYDLAETGKKLKPLYSNIFTNECNDQDNNNNNTICSKFHNSAINYIVLQIKSLQSSLDCSYRECWITGNLISYRAT